MEISEVTPREESKRAGIPRRTALLLNIGLLPLVHVVLPWAYSLLTARHGWVKGHPGRWNTGGLGLAAAGLGGLLWCLGLHFAHAPESVDLSYIFPVRPSIRGLLKHGAGQDMTYTTTRPVPGYLMREGPYRFSRNPMYLFVFAIWLGWAIFYGSISVFLNWVMYLVGIPLFVVPAEEQQLEASFGEAFQQYREKVPRWLGKTRDRALRS